MIGRGFRGVGGAYAYVLPADDIDWRRRGCGVEAKDGFMDIIDRDTGGPEKP